MKTILIILDGIADTGKNTSLSLAKIPTLNYLAKNGLTGLMYPIKGIAPESSTSQFVILGGNLKNFTGRGIIEASGTGIKIKKNHVYLRCNFAKIKNKILINTREKIPNKRVIKKLNKIDKDIKIIPTIDYRAIMIIKNASSNISNTHPGYINYKNFSKAVKGKPIEKECKGDKKTCDKINRFIEKAKIILGDKTILIRGASNKLPKIKKLKNWCLIADMPVEIGLGKLFGMKILKKSNIINQIIKTKNNIYIQIKGPDHYGHIGSLKGKINTIEKIDKKLKPLMKLKNVIICITSDHATPYQIKRHSKDPVPLLIYGKGKNKIQKFTEESCKKGSIGIIEGKDLLKLLTKRI